MLSLHDFCCAVVMLTHVTRCLPWWERRCRWRNRIFETRWFDTWGQNAVALRWCPVDKTWRHCACVSAPRCIVSIPERLRTIRCWSSTSAADPRQAPLDCRVVRTLASPSGPKKWQLAAFIYSSSADDNKFIKLVARAVDCSHLTSNVVLYLNGLHHTSSAFQDTKATVDVINSKSILL